MPKKRKVGLSREAVVLKKTLGARNFKLAERVLIPKGTKLIRPLPGRTPITAMGLSAATLKKLSPAARRLNKQTLIAAMKKPELLGKLTIHDITVIREGFADKMAAGGVAMSGDIYCCCCPCCCAAGPVEPSSYVA